MGIQLMVAAFENWADVTPHGPFRALLYMSCRALDIASEKIPRALYFGGWPAIARAMGTEEPDGNPAKQVVDRVIAKLVRLGVIECIKPGRPGSNAVYRIWTERRPKASKVM
jgi:hypothetical protein